MAHQKRFKIALYRRRRSGALSGSLRLLLGELEGLAIDFTDQTATIKDV